SGTASFTAPAQAGQYEFRYLYNDRYTDLAKSNTISVNPGSYSLSASPTRVDLGGQATVSWTAPSSTSSRDWVALYRSGDADSAYLWWAYTGGTTSGQKDVRLPLEAGDYEFRYLLDAGYTKAAHHQTVTV